MQIVIDDKPYTVPPEYVQELAEQLWAILEQMYRDKIADSLKSGMMALTRTMLVKAELAVRLTHGKEAARAMRPPPKADPNLWMLHQYFPVLQKEIEGATIISKTDGDTIGSFRIYSTGDIAWGQMDTPRCIGVREDDGLKVS